MRWVYTPSLVLLMVSVGFSEEFPVHIEIEGGYARAYLTRDGEPVLPTGFQTYEKGEEHHFLVPGELTLYLPRGIYQLRLERGLEFYPLVTTLDVQGELHRTLKLERWVDMNAAGWYSGDLHVHRAPEDMREILLAEELNFAPTITTHVWSGDTRSPWPATEALVNEVSPTRSYTANAQEVERIQGGPGAVILLAPELPLPFDGNEHYPPSSFFTRRVHAQGGYVGADKPFWVDTFVNIALGEIDFIEVNCNHFYPRSVDTDLARWSAWTQEMGYIGGRGLALWLMDLYYKILNSGFELALSAGSANGVMPAQVGFNRVYVKLDEFSYENFLSALAEGRSFTTNGPILELTVDGEHGPGTRLTRKRGDSITVRARAKSKRPLESVELVVNGSVAARSDTGSLTTTLQVDESSWVALRAFEQNSSEAQFFAHTSPVYVRIDDAPVRVAEDIHYLIDKIDALIRYTETIEDLAPQEKRELVELYENARQIYADRLR